MRRLVDASMAGLTTVTDEAGPASIPIPVLPAHAPILRRHIIRVGSAEPTVAADDLKPARLEVLEMTDFLDDTASSVDHGAPPSMVIGLAWADADQRASQQRNKYKCNSSHSQGLDPRNNPSSVQTRPGTGNLRLDITQIRNSGGRGAQNRASYAQGETK
jgi:hypothetical protein